MAALAAMNYPALWNGYPLLYSDSGTYIVSGFIKYLPVDRPYFYGWFVRHSSLAESLWLVLLAQSLVLFWVTRLSIRYLLALENTFLPACLLLMGLGLTTGLSYNNSQVMADAFSPIALLSFGVLAAGKNIRGGHRFWLVVILLFSISVHSSHLAIYSALALGLWVLKTIYRNRSFFSERKKSQGRLIFWCLASWLVISLFNYWMGAGFKPSQAPNIFIAGRCAETGAANIYLEKHCPDGPPDLCANQEKIPRDGAAFCWDFENSPLYDDSCVKEGWGNCWLNKNEAYGKMIKGILSYGPSRTVLLKRCVKDSWRQLIMFDLGYLTSMGENSPVYGGINDFLKNDMLMYQNAVQYNRTLYFEEQSAVQRWMVYAGLLVILAFIAASLKIKKVYNNLVAFALIIIAGCIINAVICAVFSVALDRYLARLIWLIPMASALFVWKMILLRNEPVPRDRTL